MKSKILLTIAVLILGTSTYAYPNIWAEQQNKLAPTSGERFIIPHTYRLYQLNGDYLKNFLSHTGTEYSSATILRLPTPEGNFSEFRVWKHSVLHPQLSEKYPEIMSFKAVSVDNPDVWAVLNYGKNGFDAMVFGGTEQYFIDPYSNIDNGYYIVYYKKDHARETDNSFDCLTVSEKVENSFGEAVPFALPISKRGSAKSNGTSKKVFRFALTCTGEYAKAVDGASPTKAGVLTAMNKTLSRINGIFEKEMNISLQLIPNNDQLIYLDPNTDPFTPSENFSIDTQTQAKNQSNTTSVIGSGNYDIGHVFCTGDGGIADLKALCDPGFEARGVTGRPNPIGDGFDVDYVAHEIGHQLGAEHTFNSTGPGCGSHAVQHAAYEPGSASSIMGYAGLCSGNNVQNNSDDYYHAKSLDQMTTYISSTNAATCGSTTAGGNNVPSVPDINATYEIPKETPFELEAPVVTDADHDALTYCWEQYDLGDFGKGLSTCLLGPTFRTFKPTASRWRVFPNIDALRQGTYSYPNEKLPTVDRQLNFRLTVRDLYQGQGVYDWSDNTVKLNVTTSSGPFRVTGLGNNNNYWRNGGSYNVTWNVANTTSAPVNCSTVDIYLSLDDGKTWPITLISNTPNDGSENITVPSGSSTASARVKVKGHNNVFFDMNTTGFTINDWPDNINDVTTENNVNIYPNPATDALYIDILNKTNHNLQLVNSLGQTVWQIETATNEQVNTSRLAAGIYYLSVTQKDNGNRYVKRVVVK